MAKIGDKIVKDSFGSKVEYEVIGFDDANNPIVSCIGIVSDDVINEEKIEDIKQVAKKPATKVPTTTNKAKKK